jgi:PAS domain S-box-containing protein
MKKIQNHLKAEITILKENDEAVPNKPPQWEQIILNLLTRFIHVEKEKLDEEIENALKQIGVLTSIDRAYVFLYNSDKNEINKTHEWCDDDIKNKIDTFKKFPVTQFPWWNNKITNNKIINLSTLDDLPKKVYAENFFLKAQSIISLLVLPIRYSDKTAGFIGFDSVRKKKIWRESEIKLLQLVAEIFGNTFKRIELTGQINHQNKQLKHLIELKTQEKNKLLFLNNSIVNATSAMVFSTATDGTILSMNPVAEKILGYKIDEVKYLKKITDFFDPANLHNLKCLIGLNNKIVFNNYWELFIHLAKNDSKPIEFNFISKDGNAIPMLLSFNAIHDKNGEIMQYSGVATDLRDKKETEKYYLMQKNLGFVLASTSSLDEGLQQVLEYVIKIKEISAVGIYLFNPDTCELEYSRSIGLSDKFIKQAQKLRGLQSFAFKKILQKGKPVYSKSSGILKYSKIFKDENMLQIGVIPIKYGNKVIGSFNIGFSQELKTLTKNVMETIASQVGGALWRINTQQKLLRNKKNFKLLFETIDDFVFIVNSNGNIIKTNPVVESRLGYTCKELKQMSLITIFSNINKKEPSVKIGDILNGKISFFSSPLYTKTGKEIPSETRIVFGEWDEEKVLIGVSRDISERLKTEEQLRSSEASWQFALDSFGDGMWKYDLKTGKLTYSDQCLRLLGYNHDEVIGTVEEWESVIHPGDIENVQQNMKPHLQGKTDFFNIEYRLLCKDGSYKWVLDRGKVISRDEKGTPQKMIGITIDMSLQKKIENSLLMNLQNERELNEMKSQFVSMASHEFRTPLSTMLMAADSLGAYWDKMSNKEINKTITKIKSNIQFLKNIIEKTLNFTHLESGKIKLVPVKTELNCFLIKNIEDIKKTYDTCQNINYSNSKTPINIPIDREMMKIVILNLLANSIKYSNPETTIYMKLYKDNGQIIIEVADKGIGIPETEKENVFKPFIRCSNINNIHGTGLGLALALKIVRLHDGNITFKSKINEGTTFFVSLPAK